MKKEITQSEYYHKLLAQIKAIYRQRRQIAPIALNSHLVNKYWLIGQYIVEYEQAEYSRATYSYYTRYLVNDAFSILHEQAKHSRATDGQHLVRLSRTLTTLLGKGFSLSDIRTMKQFYQTYPIFAELPQKLSWAHFVELLKIEDPLERSFYEKQTVIENWSTHKLIRQKKTSLFLRLAASKDKEGILKLAKEGQLQRDEEE